MKNKNEQKVFWGVALLIFIFWLITIPGIGYLTYLIIKALQKYVGS